MDLRDFPTVFCDRGSAIFNQPDYKKGIDDMRSELAQVPVPGKK